MTDRRVQDATMRRKDCAPHSGSVSHSVGRPRRGSATRIVVTLTLAAGCLAPRARADSVRLWPTAVVVGDTLRLPDLCRLDGFAGTEGPSPADIVVGNAPPPGGSRIIHIDMIRAALASSGLNMARVTLSGATQCTVTRPSAAPPPQAAAVTPESPSLAKDAPLPSQVSAVRARNDERAATTAVSASESAGARTLRDAVVSYFNRELSRYGGTADVVFDRTDDKVLELSGPAFDFRVRHAGATPLGLIPLDVDVLSDGRVVQSASLAVQVSMIRRVVIAARSINQDATVRAADVDLMAISFNRLDKLGYGDTAQVIGQRARSFIAAGSTIDPNQIESIPLVARGQIVTLTTVEGAVRIVTTATATREGRLGETITVRSGDKQRTQFDAVVIGPSAVQVGGDARLTEALRLAAGGAP